MLIVPGGEVGRTGRMGMEREDCLRVARGKDSMGAWPVEPSRVRRDTGWVSDFGACVQRIRDQ